MRFLGECRRRLYGSKDKDALELFRRAVRAFSDFPSYWANFGHAAIDSEDEETLAEFLTELAAAPDVVQRYDYVAAVWANALGKAGRDDEAANLRKQKIAEGSLNPVFYADHAKWLLDKKNDANAALTVLEQAQQRNCANDFTEAIYATALAIVGRDDEAAKLRQANIDAGSTNPAFYTDHAKWHWNQHGNADAALQVLKLASQRGCADDVINLLRRQIEDKQNR